MRVWLCCLVPVAACSSGVVASRVDAPAARLLAPAPRTGVAAAYPKSGPKSGPKTAQPGPAVSGWSGAVAERCEALEPLLAEVATKHGVDASLVAGLVRVESSFDASARSGAGALGLMQVMPATARGMGCHDLLDPAENLDCGVRVLKHFVAHYDGNLVYGLSGYNAGYRIPSRARAEGALPANLAYVEKVLAAKTLYGRHGCGSR